MQDYTKDVTNCWPIRIVIISVRILCGHNYVCFTVIIDIRKCIIF